MISFEFNNKEWKIPEERFDNMDLIELVPVADEKQWLYKDMLIMLIGENGLKEFRASVMTEDGRVPVSKYGEFLLAAFDAFGQTGKN